MSHVLVQTDHDVVIVSGTNGLVERVTRSSIRTAG